MDEVICGIKEVNSSMGSAGSIPVRSLGYGFVVLVQTQMQTKE